MIHALAGAIDAAQPQQLADLSRSIWQAHAAGRLDDRAAQALAERIEARRRSGPPAGAPALPAPGAAATPAQIAAQLLAVDRAKIHRRSVDMAAPACRIDGNDAARILTLAATVERKTYARRAKGQHGGAIGAIGLELLRLLMSFGRKYRAIFPSYERLAEMLRRDRGTVIAAMRRLIAEGFVTRHRRSKMIETDTGRRRVQDSNAYEVHSPAPCVGAAAALQLGSKSSELISSTVSLQVEPAIRTETPQRAVPDGRFWLMPPYRTADGGWL